MILKEKFVGLVTAIKNTLPSGFRNNDEEKLNLTFDEMTDVSLWMEKEKFLNFSGMKLTCPIGFNTYYIDHLLKLENVWNVLASIEEGVLTPTAQLLAGLASSPATLQSPAAFTLRTFNFPLKTINPEDLIKLLGESYNNTSADTRPIEKLFHSASEIDVTYTRAAQLRDNISKRLIKDVSRVNDSIVASTDVIVTHDINPRAAEQLALLVELNDRWVQLFGLFMKQTSDLFHALNNTGDKLKIVRSK